MSVLPPRPYFDSSLLRLNARTFAVLCPARFCGHPAFTACPVLRTPRFYFLSTFVDTTLLLPVHFCGHRAFTFCPLLWTPRFYCLSTFVDTTLFTFCPLLWTPRFYCLSDFVDTLLFTFCPVLWTLPIQGNAKFQYIGIFNDAFLRVNNGLFTNILVFTLKISFCSCRKIPVYWNFQQRIFARE